MLGCFVESWDWKKLADEMRCSIMNANNIADNIALRSTRLGMRINNWTKSMGFCVNDAVHNLWEILARIILSFRSMG